MCCNCCPFFLVIECLLRLISGWYVLSILCASFWLIKLAHLAVLGREHALGQLRGFQHSVGQDAAEAVLSHQPGGQPRSLRLVRRQVREASDVLPHLSWRPGGQNSSFGLVSGRVVLERSLNYRMPTLYLSATEICTILAVYKFICQIFVQVQLNGNFIKKIFAGN